MHNEIDLFSIRCGNCPNFQPVKGNVLPFNPESQPGICLNDDAYLLRVQFSTNPLQELMAKHSSLLVEDPAFVKVLEESVFDVCMRAQDHSDTEQSIGAESFDPANIWDRIVNEIDRGYKP